MFIHLELKSLIELSSFVILSNMGAVITVLTGDVQKYGLSTFAKTEGIGATQWFESKGKLGLLFEVPNLGCWLPCADSKREKLTLSVSSSNSFYR